MVREFFVRFKDLKNIVNYSFIFYKFGFLYNVIYGNLKCNFNKYF